MKIFGWRTRGRKAGVKRGRKGTNEEEREALLPRGKEKNVRPEDEKDGTER